jgi:DNA polymerase I
MSRTEQNIDRPPRPALLVDTYSLFFRAHHALPEMSTTLGEPTSALYGFCAVLLKELREHDPVGLAFAVDAPQRTFRRDRYEAYKSHRDAVPSPLAAQFGRLEELLQAFEVPVFRFPGFEADDVLATLARRLSAAGSPVLVMSGDRDLLQVARPDVRVLFMGARGQKPTLMDAARVEERFLVRPEQLPTYIALVGDPSDNLPGVPGVGPKTAAKWVQRYGTIRGLLAELDQLTPGRLRAELACRAEQVLLNEELATLHADLHFGDGPLTAAVGAGATGKLRALFAELEFKSLMPRLDMLRLEPEISLS